jgi:hypothetical protein
MAETKREKEPKHKPKPESCAVYCERSVAIVILPPRRWQSV